MDYKRLYQEIIQDLRKTEQKHDTAATVGCGRGDPTWKTEIAIRGEVSNLLDRARKRENLEYCEAHGYGKRISA